MNLTKDQKTGKWLCQFYYTDWQGNRKKKFKRGFRTKAEAEAQKQAKVEAKEAAKAAALAAAVAVAPVGVLEASPSSSQPRALR